jgi:hypothetical protein
MWTYSTALDTKSAWVGYDVDAVDGHIGKIDEMSTDAGRGSIVVDTGFWIFGKKRLVPAGTVSSVDHDRKRVAVSLTKDQIKNAPDFDEMRRSDETYFSESGRYYGDL